MKIIIKTLFILSLIFALTSCGGDKKSNAKFSIDISALSGTGASASGGILIVGHKLDDSAVFSKAYKSTDSDPVIELPNGQWEFFLSYWDGASPLTGSAKCAYAGPFKLEGTEVNVTFKTTNSNCYSNLPDGTQISEDFDSSNFNWPLVQINTCLDIPTSCTTDGITKSFKIKLGNETRNVSLSGETSLLSNCYSYTANPINTPVRIPSGSSNGGGGVLQAEIQLFTSIDCTGNHVKYHFKDGVKNDFTAVDYSSYYNFTNPFIQLYLNHNYATPVATTDEKLAQFGTGADGSSPIATTYASVRAMPSTTSFEVATGGTSGLNPGDEVMWYVVSDSGAFCTSVFKPGYYGFGRIKNISANTITFFNSHIAQMSVSDLVPNTYLDPAFNKCVIQLTKVINYDNLTLNNAGIAASQPYDSTSGMGGITALRVKGTLEMQSNSFIKAFESGFSEQSPYINYATDCSGIRPCLKFGRGAPMLSQLTGSVTISSTTLTGTNTQFSNDLSPGDIIQVNSNNFTIVSITDNTTASLSTSGTETSSSFFKQNIQTAGGGIVFVAARNLKFNDAAGSSYIGANTEIRDAHGGNVKVITQSVESVYYDLNVAANSFIQSKSNNLGAGQAGEAVLKYCDRSGDPAKIPDFGNINSASGYISSLNVVKNNLLCP